MQPQTIAAVSMGIGMVGSLEAGLGQRAAGKQEQAAYDYNAAIDIQNMDAKMVANQQYYSQLVGRQASAYAAAGVDITSGSPLLMMVATAGRGGVQAAEIYQQGTEEATLQRYYGKIAAWRGTMAGVGTFLSGISKSAQSYLDATGYVPGSGSDVYTGQDWGVGGN